MKSIREDLVELARTAKSEKEFSAKSLTLLVPSLTTAFSKSNFWPTQQDAVKTLIKEFCQSFTALLVIIRTSQGLDNFDALLKTIKIKGDDLIVGYLNNHLKPLCEKGDEMAMQAVALFMQTTDSDVLKVGREILLAVIKAKSFSGAVAKIMFPYLPKNENHISRASCASLTIYCKADPPKGALILPKYLQSKDENVRQSSLSILSEISVPTTIAQTVAGYLKSGRSKILWTDHDHRCKLYKVIDNFLKQNQLEPQIAVDLIFKAFDFEDGNCGLSDLVPLTKKVEKLAQRNLLFDAFLRLETKNNKSFHCHEETLKEFIENLAPEERIDFLRRSMLGSKNRDYLWFAGQYLLAADVVAARETFVAIAKKKLVNLECLGNLVQLASKVSEKDIYCKWPLEALNTREPKDFEPVISSLFEYANTHTCPLEVRLEIAYQIAMFGGSTNSFRKSSLVLADIIQSTEINTAIMRKTLIAILNLLAGHSLNKTWSAKLKSVRAKTFEALLSAYQTHGQTLLDCMVEIVSTDTRGYPMEPLFPPVVRFLSNLEAAEAVPTLKYLLNAKLPDADLGMSARGQYIGALKKFAIEGDVSAVQVIADYDGKNTWNELVPTTLTEIYWQAKSAKIKNKVIAAVAKRFIESIGHKELCYFYEVAAVLALKKEPRIQIAYLEGLAKIPKIDASQMSAGMCGLLEKFHTILPQNLAKQNMGVIGQAVENLKKAKQGYIEKCHQNRWYVGDDTLKLFDRMSAEFSLLLAGI